MSDFASDNLIASTGIVHRTRLCGDASAPLIFFVHGRAGNVSVMSIFERICPKLSNIILLQAPEEEPDGGYSWFIGKGFKEGAVEAAPVLKGYIEAMLQTYQLSPSKTIGLGFSQGGMVLSVLFQTSTILDAIALIASMPIVINYESRRDCPAVFGVHGTTDEILTQDQVMPWYRKLQELGFDLQIVIEEGIGHKIGTIGMNALTQWLKIQIENKAQIP